MLLYYFLSSYFMTSFISNYIFLADHVHTLHLKTIMTKEEDMVIMEVDKDHVVVL